MLVSVIIPLFNGQKYIKAALESVAAQTFSNWQILIVDDGSTDASYETAHRWAPPRSVFLQQRNQGPAAARNLGLQHAQGECIAFLDADDLWLPQHLELQAAALAADRDIGYSRGLSTLFVSEELEGDSGRLGISSEPTDSWLPGTMLVRRQTFDKVGHFDGKLYLGDTMDWIARANKLDVKAKLIRSVVLRRRVHPGSLTATKPEVRRDYLKAARRWMQNQQDRATP